jgi:hypothetical protein
MLLLKTKSGNLEPSLYSVSNDLEKLNIEANVEYIGLAFQVFNPNSHSPLLTLERYVLLYQMYYFALVLSLTYSKHNFEKTQRQSEGVEYLQSIAMAKQKQRRAEEG